MELSYNITPLVELQHRLFDQGGVRVIVKREDMNHPQVSGNKWWKLKYNITEALNRNCDTLLTFGGAYSNHIYATAAAANECGLKSVGIIRGDELTGDNPTLRFAASVGMQFEFVDRNSYREKETAEVIHAYLEKYPNAYIVPEGGTNELAIKGVTEFATKYLSEVAFDYLVLPVGTGGTMAGIINGTTTNKKIIGISSLKGGSFLADEIKKYLDENSKEKTNWQVLTDYHFGGYGKVTKGLIEFIADFERDHKLPLDPVYTGKAMAALREEIKKGNFTRGSTILFLHTGGLQGRGMLLNKY